MPLILALTETLTQNDQKKKKMLRRKKDLKDIDR